LAQLRDIVPIRPLTRIEAVAVAERQALLLLKLAGIRQPPVPERLVRRPYAIVSCLYVGDVKYGDGGDVMLPGIVT
jgi:hypothetical protein